MDRRKSIKALLVGSVSAGVIVEACKPGEQKTDTKAAAPEAPVAPAETNRMPEEEEHYKEATAKTFFTPEEMATITILGDIIIPKDEISGSASDAKVPEFIEFIVKDMPKHKIPMRGGLRWLEVRSLNKFGKSFEACTEPERLQLVDEIAYPERKETKADPTLKQGVSFFNLMRNLVATGFYTSQIGVKDLGYAGNTPNQWNGVPDDVLKQHNLAYTEKELKECVSFPKT